MGRRRVILSDHGVVAAHDSDTGRNLWTYPMPGSVVAGDDNVVLIALGNRETHVVDAETGQPRLSYWGALVVSGRNDPDRPHSVLVGKHIVLLGSHDEHDRFMLRTIDLESGQRLWTHWPDAWVLGIAATDTRVLMARAGGSVSAFETTSGRLVWEHACQAQAAPRVRADRAYVLSSVRHDISTLALDLDTGRVCWKMPRSFGCLAADRLVALSDDRSTIELWNAATGRRESGADIVIKLPPTLRQYRPLSILLVSDTHIFVAGSRGEGRTALMCLDRASGTVWGHTPPDGGEILPPVLTGTGFCYQTSKCVFGFARVG